MDKIAFVCQRYGTQVNGGAEAECRQYAERLTGRYEVEVITTCAVDHVTWRNEYPEGESVINGVRVRRFASLQERNIPACSQLQAQLEYASEPNRALEETFLREQGPYCPAALDYIRAHAGEYKAVFFMTYLYYLTAKGLPGFPGNGILIPTAHDEWALYMGCYREIFEGAAGFLYNSDAERRLVDGLFLETSGKPWVTAGAGVELPGGELPDIRERFGLSGDYLLYAGRVEAGKGCGELLEHFEAYKKRYGGKLKLVFMGKASMAIPHRPDIVTLGFVTEEEKFAVMAGARALALCSHFESLSIVVLESLLMGRPVLVNGECPVLRDHVVRGNCGLYFRKEAEFTAALHWMLEHPAACDAMGRNGRRYVAENYRWDIVTAKLAALIEVVGAGKSQAAQA